MHVRATRCVVFCWSYCRTMAKRASEIYLTDQNWDKEQPEEEVQILCCYLNCWYRCRMHFMDVIMAPKCIMYLKGDRSDDR